MIYFDSAATTLQKPVSVHRFVAYAMQHMASPGRGGYKASMQAAKTVFDCRLGLAEYFDLANPAHVVFTHNATHALNIAIKSKVRAGEHVLVSAWEHNSVMRPLFAVGAEVEVAKAPLFDASAQLHAFESRIKKDTKLIVCTHVSNVFGFVLPLEGIADLCKKHGIAFIIDASQSAGVLPISMQKLNADFIAMPGHKALYGPQGTGVLLCKNAPEHTLLEGGTGGDSLSPNMPEYLPEALEAGTMNVAGIAGLLAGLNFVKSKKNILVHEQKLLSILVQRLKHNEQFRLFYTEDKALQTGVLSIQKKGQDSEQFAEHLGAHGFCTRAGLHCSPSAHRAAGTLDAGTVRISFSAFNTEKEVEKLSNFLNKGRK